MTKLAALLYVIVAPTAMGVLFTVALVAGLDSGAQLTVAALLGAAAAAPLSWYAARAMMRRTKPT